MEKTSNKVLIICGIVFCTVLLAVLSVAFISWSTDNNNIHEFVDGACYGFVRGYIEPDEFDDMYMYIILDDGYYVTRFSVYALTKDVYDNLDDGLKQLIDNRETGYLLSGVTAYNGSQFDRLGYSYIKYIRMYDTEKESPHEIQERDYNW